MASGSGVENTRDTLTVLAGERLEFNDTVISTARIPNPLPRSTLGASIDGVEIDGPRRFSRTMVMVPFDSGALIGIDERTVHFFRIDAGTRAWTPIWDSGISLGQRFAWAKVARPGTYVPIGLPRDSLLLGLVRALAHGRKLLEGAEEDEKLELNKRTLRDFLNIPPDELDHLRAFLASLERQSSLATLPPDMLRPGRGGTSGPFPFPRNATMAQLRDQVKELEITAGGLPEEQLLTPPDTLQATSPAWPLRPGHNRPSPLGGSPLSPLLNLWPINLCWLWSTDWPMYHADTSHSGDAHGCSGISSWTAHNLYPLSPVPLSGGVISVPALVDGKAYVGTSTSSSGGTLYRIDLATASVDWQLPVPGSGLVGYNSWGDGVASTPSVTGGRVYFSSLDGKVRCVDANTPTTQYWVTDLRNPDPGQKQPCDNSNPPVACWTSPLVVNGKVYVGCGLGEDAPSPPFVAQANFGFVYCLDASTGHVIWLFCTNKFPDVTDNSPNDIPHSQLTGTPPAPFTRHGSDPTVRGASIWSSPVYDPVLNRIYVGTGNPNPDHALPNEAYSSGVLSLDGNTGAFKGFFQPDVADSYRGQYDLDVDMPSSPTLVWRGPDRLIAIGSKNGSFFLLNPDGLGLVARRQMLPYYNDDPTQPIPAVDPHSPPPSVEENHSGTYSCAAVDYSHGVLFCGLGGWGNSLDNQTTPFLRAMRWDTLADAWPTVVGVDGVRRYQVPGSPLYQHPGERALSSPAVVHDVVFVSTNEPALYALDTATGACLWQAPDLTSGGAEILGPAVSGDFVAIGYQSSLHIYHRWSWVLPPWWWRYLVEGPWPPIPPLPGPGPDPGPEVEIGVEVLQG